LSSTTQDWLFDDILISTEKERLEIQVIFNFITHSYWAKGRSKESVQRSIENSLCFGAYRRSIQVGFARVLTDYTAVAYLMDVFVLEELRGRGIGRLLIECALNHPDLKVVKWFLKTSDAHSLYEKFGFTPLKDHNSLMVKHQQKLD